MKKTNLEAKRDLEIMNEIASKSKLTEADVKEISDKINHAAAKKLGLA